MDILNLIKDKILILSNTAHFTGLKSVILHVDVAEEYFLRAVDEGDENLFTDVIYRTNHAFEGILKEAFEILAGKKSSQKTPNEIERYLSSNNILKPRVLELFTNYRTGWRNPSTHDYKLFFTEHEAFLAIVTVTAFVNILLDQIIEKISYDYEQSNTSSKSKQILSEIENYATLPLIQKVKELLIQFTLNQSIQKVHSDKIKESQIIGYITGFINQIDPNLEIMQESRLLNNNNLRPDLIIKQKDESIIVEIKRFHPTESNLEMAENQLFRYFDNSEHRSGIVYFYSTEKIDPIVDDFEFIRDSITANIIFIKPAAVSANV